MSWTLSDIQTSAAACCFYKGFILLATHLGGVATNSRVLSRDLSDLGGIGKGNRSFPGLECIEMQVLFVEDGVEDESHAGVASRRIFGVYHVLNTT